MTVTYATISGQWLGLTGEARAVRATSGTVVGHIEAATANGLLTSAGKVLFQSTPIVVDASGNASVTLPVVPQDDISPSDPFYRLVAYVRRGQAPMSLVFQLAADTTWDQVLLDAVGNVEPSVGLVAQLNELTAVIDSFARRATLVDVFGHSYTTDGATASGFLWPNALQRMVGATTLNNYGVTGAKLVQGGGGGNLGGYIGALRNLAPTVTRDLTNEIYSPNTGIIATTWGYNDAGDDATSTGTNVPAMVKAWKYAVRAMLSHFQASAQMDQTGTSTPATVVLAGSGSWTLFAATNQNVGTGYYQNTSSGATVTVTTPSNFKGGVVALHFLTNRVGGTTPASDVTFTVDGTPTHPIGHSASDPFTTKDINPSVISSQGPAAARFNLSAGTHVIVATSATGGAAYDRLIVEARPYPRPVLWANIARTPASTSTRLTAIAALNAATPLVAAEFPADSFRLVDIDTPLGNDPVKFSDDVHPNDWGHALVAEAFAYAWTTLPVLPGQLSLV